MKKSKGLLFMLKLLFPLTECRITRHGIYINKKLQARLTKKVAEGPLYFPYDLDFSKNGFEAIWEKAITGIKASPKFLEMTVSDYWLRYFVFTPPNTASSLDDMRGFASMRFETLFNQASEDWVLRSDWSTTGSSLVCAIPRHLIDQIQASTKMRRQCITSLQPNFIKEWNKWKNTIKDGTWFAVCESTGLVVAVAQFGSIVNLLSVPYGAEKNGQWLINQLIRFSVLARSALPEQLEIVGEVPTHWNLKKIMTNQLGDKYSLSLVNTAMNDHKSQQ
ncbi:hypothetical protein ACO0KY_17855 [Undibacterium sp. Dicai25W]|uniref:hypothetical protein n=1 Tax=Undibacterium sp. Dicai25W TaxID=3413034 RepID=UPI003BF36ADD